jgi:outer membrane usher protein
MLVACLAAAPATAAEANERDQQAIFAFFVNTVEVGEAYAVIRGGDVLMARSDLQKAGLRGFEATEELVAGRTLVSLASVRPRLKVVVDEAEVAIRLDVPVELFAPQHIDLGGAPGEVSRERRTSAFINYAPRVALSSDGPATGSGFAEAAVSESNWLLYSSASANTETGAARGLTNANFDDTPRLRRLTLGDTSVSAGPIGATAVMAGVTFARDFSIDPYFVRSPAMRFASSTHVPATVDVYVNGIRTRSETIEPGTFTLDNVRGLAGAGTVRYVVRDAFGREQRYFKPYYIAPTVLAKGVEDYALSTGLLRDAIGVESFAYRTPSLIGYYRRGISDAVTIGARGEAGWERASGGPSVSTATPVGQLEIELGASSSEDGGSGAAAVLSYGYLCRDFNVGGSVRWLSDRYATVSLDPQADRSVAQVNVFTSVPIGPRISYSTASTIDVHRDLPTLGRVSAITQIQLGHDVTALAEVALVTTGPFESSVDSFVSLTWTPTSRLYTSIGARTTQGEAGANLQVTRPATFGEDWSMAAAVDASKVTRTSIRSRLQTKSNTISAYFDQTPQSASLSVEPAGSLVWVDEGGLFLSRPVDDAFALVRVPDVQGVRVYVNSQEVGRTNAGGYALVPWMISHYGSQIKLATEDVPLDYALERDSLVAAPPRRGAAYVLFPASRVHYYRGRLRLIKAGVEIVPVYGELVVKNRGRELVSPIGEQGAFEFEGLGPGRHEAVIRYKEDRCRFSFDATDAGQMLVDLGTFDCEIE